MIGGRTDDAEIQMPNAHLYGKVMRARTDGRLRSHCTYDMCSIACDWLD